MRIRRSAPPLHHYEEFRRIVHALFFIGQIKAVPLVEANGFFVFFEHEKLVCIKGADGKTIATKEVSASGGSGAAGNTVSLTAFKLESNVTITIVRA